MVNKLLLPQEIETFYIIPTLRRYLAVFMAERGVRPKDIAVLLRVNKSAISQYKSAKRGHNLEFPKEIVREIRKSALLIHDTLSYLRETQRLLACIRETKVLCQVHKHISPVPKSCEPDTVGCQTSPIKICGP